MKETMPYKEPVVITIVKWSIAAICLVIAGYGCKVMKFGITGPALIIACCMGLVCPIGTAITAKKRKAEWNEYQRKVLEGEITQ